MEKYKNLKKGTKVGLIISLGLVVISMVLSIIGLVKNVPSGRPNAWLHIVINLVSLILIVIYALFGFKKPHGNMLRYTFFIFGLSVLVQGIIPTRHIEGIYAILVSGLGGFAAMLSAYIGGRLNKIEKNKILMVIVGVVLVAFRMIVVYNLPVSTVNQVLSNLAPAICWAALGFAYTARYEEHKAAGLEDK